MVVGNKSRCSYLSLILNRGSVGVQMDNIYIFACYPTIRSKYIFYCRITCITESGKYLQKKNGKKKMRTTPTTANTNNIKYENMQSGNCSKCINISASVQSIAACSLYSFTYENETVTQIQVQ